MTIQIGVDLGGSNLRAAAFGAGDDATPLEIHREAVGDDRAPDAIVERVARTIERLAGDSVDPIAVGVGVAGLLRDRRGTVASSPHLRWRDVPFGELLHHRLGSRPGNRPGTRYRLGVYNDVNAITWGEAVAGAARGCRDVLAVYVGTGIGGGLIIGGQLVEGASHCAGEIGHTKVRWDAEAAPCMCGGRGCVEAYLGGHYLVPRIRRELSRARLRTTVIERAGGAIDAVTPGHVDAAALDGDEWALGLWTELAALLAVALGNALAILNSQRLVLGGGVLARTPTLREMTEIDLMLVAPPASLEPLTIAVAELGDGAGLVGAARLARDVVSIITGS
ncbi:MAG TPA: ROK family protein [Kofleriaceae bacterium]|nr:ROK family protein [Kofleriaceae bacterium]